MEGRLMEAMRLKEEADGRFRILEERNEGLQSELVMVKSELESMKASLLQSQKRSEDLSSVLAQVQVNYAPLFSNLFALNGFTSFGRSYFIRGIHRR